MSKLIKVLAFLVLILAVAGYVLFERNSYSKEGLKLEIIGPQEINLGEETEYIVKYKNNGDFRLENPTLLFEPPAFSIKDDKIYQKEILTSDKLGGAIYPGEEKTFSFKMRLVGKEGEAKIAKATLNYQPKNLKTTYESATSFTTVIKSVPLTFEYDLPSKLEADKDFNFKLNYASSIPWLLTDLRVQVEYPSGYEFIESTPKSLDKTEWDIPVLNNNEAGSIDVVGRISGNIGDAKVFRAKLGIWKDGEFTLLKEIEKGVEIQKPSVSIRQDINGNPKYVAKPGDWLHYEIYFKNISGEDQYNLYMINKLDGDLFDFNAIKSETGSFEQGDNSIIFDWRKNSKLQYLAPMEEGKAEFWIKLKDDLSQIKKPSLSNSVMIGQASQYFTTKISSKLELVQKTYYSDEIFGNSGPIPPVVGQTTTYTVTWQAKNYYSDVKSAVATAMIPKNVKFTGQVFPEQQTGKLIYDADSGKLTWNIGDLKTGQGVITAPENVSFQVSITPSSDDIAKSVQLVGAARISGNDKWTAMVLEAETAALDTVSLSDQNMTEDKGKVINSN
ncbi:MAG: hypothetical protein NTX14_00670 [Candidatus Nealsonbacteria bacterium]|nr:hypothetical protein [Candidatus Nealsonbacteria bacterium]